MSTAGIVIYKLNTDGSLDGHWTHTDLQGALAVERAWGGTPGKLPGVYDVVIMTPNDHTIFEGTLTISDIGQAFNFTWSGTQLLPSPKPANYTGIGIIERGDMVVATFQEADSAQRQESVESPWKEIEETNGEFGAAYANADSRGLAELYTPSAQLFPPEGQIVQGREAIERFWKDAMGSELKGVKLQTKEVESFGDTAIETGAATMYNKDGDIIDNGKYVVVWKRLDTKWRLHRDCWNTNTRKPS